jgi:hypothetical protein
MVLEIAKLKRYGIWNKSELGVWLSGTQNAWKAASPFKRFKLIVAGELRYWTRQSRVAIGSRNDRTVAVGPPKTGYTLSPPGTADLRYLFEELSQHVSSASAKG